VGENADQIAIQYGNVAPASIASIQRALLTLEDQGGDKLFGEPAVELTDLMRTAPDGRGVVNLLAADRLMTSPKLYATFLLWLLSELFEELPEVGDLPRPKLVVFFDEAHLLFDDAPPALLSRIEQVVRLIRSKGVGVFFVTQNPADIPDTVLGQLGNKVQHALRAFTPKDQQAVKAVADNFRPNPSLDVAQAVTELGIGEALISLLDASATPMPVERALVVPPHGHIGAIDAAQRMAVRNASLVGAKYEQAVDRESAYETLKSRAEQKVAAAQQAAAAAPAAPAQAQQQEEQKKDDDKNILENRAAQAAAAALGAAGISMIRSMGSAAGRQLMRGILGGLGGSRKR
jgi:DNA helicase HerA-like ATPase